MFLEVAPSTSVTKRRSRKWHSRHAGRSGAAFIVHVKCTVGCLSFVDHERIYPCCVSQSETRILSSMDDRTSPRTTHIMCTAWHGMACGLVLFDR